MPANSDDTPTIIELLSTCSFTEAVALWNEGFKGYAIDLSMSLDRFIARLHNEGLSIEKSLVARVGGQPVGFLLNGIRKHGDKVVAWNGGTGVIPESRGRGVGRALVEYALQIYEAEKVDYAMLEAISTNTAAIALYRSCGYEQADELTFLQNNEVLEENCFSVSKDYEIKIVPPSAVGQLKFYETFVPWQAQWQSLNENRGAGLIVSDREGSPAGYALFRKLFDDKGNLSSIALHQCVADPSRADDENILMCALHAVYSPLSIACRRSTHNFMKSQRIVLDILQRTGFTTFIEQALMRYE